MANIKSKIGDNIIWAGVSRIVFVPWVKDEGGKWSKGETGFCLDDVVADSTSISQDEAETNAIDCETRDEPIVENITLGSYQFSCESANMDADILKHCFGFTVTGAGKTLKAYAPATYQENWAEIEIQFQNGGSTVLPKVKMAANVDETSLKTGVFRGVIKGTAYTTKVGEGENAIETPYYISATYVNEVTE